MTNAEMRQKCLSPFLEQEALYKERICPNIEKYRKGDFRLRLTDRDGKPLAGVTVEVRQETHDFKYGANIFMLDEFPTDAENAAYRALFHRYFNLATVPFYWGGIEPKEGHPRYAADSEKVARRPAPDLCMDYCREHGIAPKLHCLFYDKWIPSWLPKTDADAMRRLYEKRFGEIAARYKDALYEVEVVNEMLEEQYWKTQSVLCAERDIVEWAFALARKHFPQSKLVFNEGCRVPFIAAADYRDPYILMLDRAIARGASVDKIGIQNHIFCGATCPQEEDIDDKLRWMDPVKQIKAMDVLSSFGKPLEITEVTVPTVGTGDEAEALQAEILRYLYTLWFSIPQMETVVYWNTVEGTAWNAPNGAWRENDCRGGLFRRDFTPKPAADMLYHLFHEEWCTKLTVTTDENGCADLRGFYGDYTAAANGTPFTFGIHRGDAIGKTVIL